MNVTPLNRADTVIESICFKDIHAELPLMTQQRILQSGLEREVKFVRHSDVIRCRDVFNQLGIPFHQIMKALVYVNETERFYMACVTAEQRVDVRKTMKLFSISSLRLADKQTIEKSLGIPLGALSPLTVPCYVPICVDKNVFEQQIVYMGSGSRTISVILKPEYLRNLDNVVVADIKEAP